MNIKRSRFKLGSQWPRGLRRGRAAIAGSNPAGGISVSLLGVLHDVR